MRGSLKEEIASYFPGELQKNARQVMEFFQERDF